MIVDSSAVVAILFDEPEAGSLLDRLADAPARGIAAPTLVECDIVTAARLGADSRPVLRRFVTDLEVETVPFGLDHWSLATDAWLRFGRGRHRAALNFGDCISYAAARLARRPLLCVGTDFARTDLELA